MDQKFFRCSGTLKQAVRIFLGINRTSLDGSKKVPPYVYYCIGNHAIHSDDEIPEMNNKQLCAFTNLFFFSDLTHAYIIFDLPQDKECDTEYERKKQITIHS